MGLKNCKLSYAFNHLAIPYTHSINIIAFLSQLIIDYTVFFYLNENRRKYNILVFFNTICFFDG